MCAATAKGPALRRYRQELTGGGLLDRFTFGALDQHARHDQEARREHETLRLAYLARRDGEARQRKHRVGLAARLAHGRTVLYAIVDRDRLRLCRRCDEIVYPPEPEQRGTVIYESTRQPSRCHFCGGSGLAPWDAAYLPLLENGVDDRLVGSDLTFAGIDGLMDDQGDKERSDL